MCFGCGDNAAPAIPTWALLAAFGLVGLLCVTFWVLVGWACVVWL